LAILLTGVLLIAILAGCGTVDSKSTTGGRGENVGTENTTESPEVTTEAVTTEEPTTEEPTTEEPTTEEPTIEAPTTEASTTEAPTESQTLVETELGFESAKREILTLYPGSELGQVGYSEEGRVNEQIGPESFVVEGEKIYILDWVNKRILMFEEGKASGSINVSEYDRTRYMGYGNGCIAVAGSHRGNGQIIGVYSADSNGEKVAEIDLYDTKIMLVNKIVSVDDTGVEFNGDGMKYVKTYYEQMLKLAEYPEIDIIAHFDLLTKFCEKIDLFDMESKEYKNIAFETLEVLAKTGKFFEINSGAISRGYRTTPYPAPFILKEMSKLGCKIVITTDCHNKEFLDCNIKESKLLAKECGFKEFYVLKDSEFVPVKL